MASAWSSSFGSAWGSSWGVLDEIQPEEPARVIGVSTRRKKSITHFVIREEPLRINSLARFSVPKPKVLQRFAVRAASHIYLMDIVRASVRYTIKTKRPVVFQLAQDGLNFNDQEMKIHNCDDMEIIEFLLSSCLIRQ